MEEKQKSRPQGQKTTITNTTIETDSNDEVGRERRIFCY
jgi:hypothetical protein